MQVRAYWTGLRRPWRAELLTLMDRKVMEYRTQPRDDARHPASRQRVFDGSETWRTDRYARYRRERKPRDYRVSTPAVRGKSPVEGAAGSCGCSARSEEDGDPGDLLRRTTKPTTLGGRLRGRTRRQAQNRRWNKKTSGAQRVTRRFRSTAQRVQRRVPGTARRYAIGPGRVTPPV